VKRWVASYVPRKKFPKWVDAEAFDSGRKCRGVTLHIALRNYTPQGVRDHHEWLAGILDRLLRKP
jgi:hypothetical protein